MLLSLIVLCRIVSNPLSNVFQKLIARRGADPLYLILLTHALLSVICLPMILALRPHLSHVFWLNIGIVAVLTVSGNALLVAAVRLSDLSVLGPVNAYKAIISLIPGMLVLGEFPGRLGIAGMGLIVAGSYFIVDKRVSEPRRNVFVRFFTERGVQLRFAAMVVSAVEAVFLKKALLASTVLTTFSLWAVLGCAASVIAIIILNRKDFAGQQRIAVANRQTALFMAACTGVMQLCTIIVLGGFQVGYALALFQTSALLSVFLGHHVFKEKNILERLGGSAVMVAGAILIVVAR